MGALAALGAALSWACASLLFERFGRSAGGLALNLVKCVLAFALMVPTLLLFEGNLWPSEIQGRSLWLLVASGVVGLSIGDTFWFSCLLRLGARRALLLFTLAPPITAVMATVVLGEPFSPHMLVGMVVTLGGVAWVISERDPADPEGVVRTDWLGIALGVAAAFCQAGGGVLTKLAGVEHSSLAVSEVRLAAGALGLIVVVALSGRMHRAFAPFKARRSAAGVVVATILGTYLGIWLMNTGFLRTYVGVAATLNATSPIFVLPLAALFFGQSVSRRSVAGALIAVAGVALLFVSAGSTS